MNRTLRAALLPLAFCLCVTAAGAQDAKIIQPGAPGKASKEISAEEASDLAGILYTDADVKFMQGMIGHHAQALEMTKLLETRTEREDMRALAGRIELSQKDEIQMMEEWLRGNGQDVPERAMHAHHGHMMPGMLTAEQMAELEAAEKGEFDKLFLEYMIAHHQGALVMVEDLMQQPGAAQESTIFGFTADVVADQSAEIDRMGNMLAEFSSDPRVNLSAGFRDAGQALGNLTLVAELGKPVGFFSPDNPEGIPVPPEEEGEEEEEEPEPSEEDAEGEEEGEEEEEGEAEEEEEPAGPRPGAALLNFANSDMAFAGDILFEGNFHGFNTYNVEDPQTPRLLASIVCPGGQGDVSVVGDLLIMSVEQTRGRLDCGLQGVAEPVSAERFRGVRIFDISDLAVPQQVAAVQTCRGSHTHTIVTDPDDDGTFYVYGSGTSSVRSGEELEGCSKEDPGEDENTALFSIDVIEVSMERPEDARVVNRPRIFADPETGRIAGLWKGGRHGVGTQRTAITNQCHDITVYPEIGLAAGACSGNGILLDVSDPVKPVRLDAVVDEGFAYWHSATFNNAGDKVVFTDEWGGGMRPRCRASDPKRWGANAIFDIVDRKLEFRGYYKLPAPQTENENCVAHNGSLIPVPGRDIMVQAWYQGGISVFDFTDSAEPVEIAYFDRGPIAPDQLVMGGHWSAYWYKGHIYGTEIARGLDVLSLEPSEFLTQNEIDAATLIEPEIFNPQQQRRIDYPAEPAIARALQDQLVREEALDATLSTELTGALDAAQSALEAGRADGAAASELGALAEKLGDAKAGSARNRERLASLVTTLQGLGERLR
ncbi:MAG: DUF305 domain-containing protein [Acidobacteriota bacterium]